MTNVMYDTNEVARHTQSLAGGLSDPAERAWYLEHIESLMVQANRQQAQIATMVPLVFSDNPRAFELLKESEIFRKRMRADVHRVTEAEKPDFRVLAPHIASLHENAEFYKEKAEAASKRLRSNTEARMARTKWLGLLGVALVLFGLMIEGHFLFRPLVERLAEAIHLEEERREVERQNVHLARLQKATEEAYGEVEMHRQALQSQAQELESALGRAEEASRLKSEFLANMSHEIRTPLNGVVGMTEVLARTPLTEQQRESVQTISLSAESLLRIINDILDLSKVEAGRLVIESAPFSLQRVLNSVIETHAKAASDKGLNLEVTIKEGTDSYVSGDAARIGQILTNLIGNAIKFSENGTIEVVAETFRQEGHVRLKVSVLDHGIGISEERLPELFSPFTQADGSTTRLYGGTGLGLAIVKQLSELMGGWAGASSEPGKGSEFWFIVTVQPASPPPTTTEHVLVSVPKGLRVLLVEDNAVNQLVGTRLLESEGCTVTIAHDGLQAVQQAQDGEFDVILMDVHMPGMDGLQATATIRAQETTARIPIIAMTADAMEREVKRAMAAGMDDYLSKPVRGSELREMLAKWAPPVQTA